MSSPYQILDNRPIDQWKVTELKEELKKRKLTTRGLKEDLVKRLDEAVRIERENTQDDADNGLQSSPHPAVVVKSGEAQEVLSENFRAIVDDSGTNIGKGDNHPGHVDSNNSAASFDQGNIQEGYVLVGKDSTVVEETLVVHATTLDASITVTESVVSDVTLRDQDLPKSEIQEENEASKSQLENEDSKSQLENEDAKPQLDGEHIKLQVESDDSKPQVESDDSKPQVESDDSKPQVESGDSKLQIDIDNLKPQLEIDYSKSQLENEYSKPTSEEVTLDVSAPENQVSEVRPNLGSQKYDSISTDSVSINEKIELKDNIIADNVKLELDVIKPEMVAPSSSTIVPASGDSHPMDVEEPHESNTSVEEKDDTNGTNADLSKKNDSLDVGYSEKLNLDRSSGDDSMEEDVMESKQIDSKYSSDDVGYRSEKNEISDRKEEGHVDVVGDDFSADGKDAHVENKGRPSAPAEKRKLNDESLVGNSEPVKRQRRWNSASLKVPEPQSSNITATTPKDSFQSPASKGFARVDSVTNEDSPKERVVPPSPKPPTTSLRIDRFLRPFTLKAVQELLGKTGNVTSFWMDHIKTHCYVTYSSVEEAIETRNAVYNLQWPPNGGRLLVAEFVDPREVKTRLETPQAPVASANAAPVVSPTPSATQPQQSPHQVRQPQLVAPPSLPPPPPLTNPPQARERLPLPPPPPLPEKLDPPIVTLDDLFRKTKATPRIYYLPLSEEQVNTKLAAQGKSVKQ
ncbi:Nucleotide-binding alpha-beta plait domain containing protein [Trema orientale]|uniref:Nucleotide-binding alpha-beta plait domain containing protein n=1 Tax=Trema orientale TaxID=63057 RepID=A0A2P5BZG6_TREOI|nr:Nucleotide-binding alpha-beta plait domain containing protein [Trema orientale]